MFIIKEKHRKTCDINDTIFISVPLHIVRYLNRFDCIVFYPWNVFCLQM